MIAPTLILGVYKYNRCLFRVFVEEWYVPFYQGPVSVVEYR